MPRTPLPIDPELPALLDALRAAKSVVLEAPPGAGKTTRVPAAILDAGIAGKGDVVVLEPRRLAARLAARRVADERGERVGETVGYQVRFEDATGPGTRLRFLTEGIFSRLLVSDPALRGIGCVVLDEFHERHLATDLALAAVARLQRSSREDLALVVMSATLDAEPVAAYLDGCPRVRAAGRSFPVEIEHAATRDDRPLELQVAAALGRLVARGLDGDVLVFLPGAAEIRRAMDACRGAAAAHRLLLVALHGDLPADEQDRAIRPATQRKVILSTNVAETSVTIEGVAAVIDGGLARVASHSAWTGLPVLRTEKVSRASATQRAGRAGRTRAGVCLRLYTRADHDARPAFDRPEALREDLAETVLDLAATGVTDPAAFPWFTAPPAAALSAATELLLRLDAVDARGALTSTGRAMLSYPLHPRLSRLVVEGTRRGVGADAAAAAALLSERDLRLSSRGRGFGASPAGRSRAAATRDAGPSDVLAMLDALAEARRLSFDGGRCFSAGIDAGAARAADRAATQVERIAARGDRVPRAKDPEAALALALLLAFPDRVAKRRKAGAREVLLSSGGAATLAEESVVADAEWMVALDAEERPRGGPLVRVASAIDPEALLEAFPDRVREARSAIWDAKAQRVELVAETRYDELVLEATRRPAAGEPEATALLSKEALAAGPGAFADPDDLAHLVARVAFVAGVEPRSGLVPLGPDDLRAALAACCEGLSSFSDVKERGFLAFLRGRLPSKARAALDANAPETVALHGGWSPRVRYAAGKPPFIEAAIQDFFGLAKGPAVAGGRVPVTLHLLAPNKRPVQVTTDLAGFWERQWPAVRRELSRRYPRHAWPEDPLAATPPARGGGRTRRGERR